ncbi:MAG TPA: DUF6510 family protein [Streptosporangiaceae bacterium]|nr:DUF6510 family protein [Streptosporangiaceae bacterium]
MDALDGNAIGGLLHEVFGTEMTAAIGTCANCGRVAPVAETLVYLQAPGTVMRCRRCFAVLMVVVLHADMKCVDLLGMAALEPATP